MHEQPGEADLVDVREDEVAIALPGHNDVVGSHERDPVTYVEAEFAPSKRIYL